MRIGIDARFYRQSGIGRYIRNLISDLQKIDTENDYYIFLLREDIGKITFSKNFHPVEANFKWYGLEEQIKFPKLLNQYQLDLVHFPHFNVPLFYRGSFVVTIHDLIHQNFPMKRATTHGATVYRVKQLGYKRIFKHALTKSQKVLTVSEYVANQLVKKWRVDKSKIVITLEGVEPSLIDQAKNLNKEAVDQILAKFSIQKPFIFYVGNAHPHKNVEGLIKTFLRLKKKYQNLSLVLGGHDHYFWARLKDEYHDKEGIIFAGFLTDSELIGLYKSAEIFVMPSLEEGFGIPILEAFACGCPVVSSNAASLPEVGGEAALYFDPKDLSDMSTKISQLLDKPDLCQQLTTKGHSRYKQFSWQELAKTTLSVYGGHG